MGWNQLGRGWGQALSMAVVVAAVFLPVAISLLLAGRQARAEQERIALHYAGDVLRRSESTADQIGRAFARMARVPGIERCGPEALSVLRAIDAGSSYIQLVGVVERDAIACSSLGLQSPPLPLGEIDYVSAFGLRMREDVRLPFAPEQPFVVAANDRFAAVIHKALPVDATVAEPGVALAVTAGSPGHSLATRGDIDPAWLPTSRDLPPGGSRIVRSGGSTVAQMRSGRYDLLSMAAVGDRHYNRTVARFAWVMVPFGLLAGTLLGWYFLRLMRAQTSLAAAIRAGLRNHEFFIELQPIVRLHDRRWVGAEVLLRWRRQDGRMVRPDLFIAAAEEAGLIRQVTARVLDLSQPVLHALARHRQDAFLSVNLAAADLVDETLPDELGRLLAATGARASQLHVEITERAFVDTALARRQLERIRECGIPVSIDDFGTGYSSLSELVSLEVDALKIDKAFVDTIGSEAVTSHVAEHIVKMAHALSLKMIAEGIESPAQAEALAGWQVQYGQGWLFSRSIPVEAFLSRLGGEGVAESPRAA